MGGSWIHTTNYGPLHLHLAMRFNTNTMDSDQKNIIAKFFGNLVNGSLLMNRSRYMFNTDSFKLIGIGGDKIVLSGLRKGKTYIIFIIMGILENLFDLYKLIHSKGKYCNEMMEYDTNTSDLHILNVENFFDNFYDKISSNINIGKPFIDTLSRVEKNEILNCLVYYEDKYNTIGFLEIVKLLSGKDLYKLLYKVIIEIEKLHTIKLLHLDINCSNLLVRVPDTFTTEFSTSINVDEFEVVLIDFDTVEVIGSMVGKPTNINRVLQVRLNPYTVGNNIELNPHKYNKSGEAGFILTPVVDYAAFALVGIEAISLKYNLNYDDFYGKIKDAPFTMPIDDFKDTYTKDNYKGIIPGLYDTQPTDYPSPEDDAILYKLICLLVGESDLMVNPDNDENKLERLTNELITKIEIFNELKYILDHLGQYSPPVSPTTP